MPKITAATVAEHVRQQEQAILDAAAQLFAERGVAGTDLADIARAVGLARPSLYRYFPDKDHILLLWFQREMEPAIVRSEQIVAGPGTPEARLSEWLAFQLEYVTDPAHQLAPRLGQEVGATSAQVQEAIAADHARLYGTLRTLVDEALAAAPTSGRGAHRPRDAGIVVGLLIGLVRAASQSVTGGADLAAVRRELDAAARAVLSPT
jgi:AcrR family transcriptional regulator